MPSILCEKTWRLTLIAVNLRFVMTWHDTVDGSEIQRPTTVLDVKKTVKNGIPSNKLTWQWKIPILCRKYIFKWSISHCYVSLLECKPINWFAGFSSINSMTVFFLPLFWLLGGSSLDVSLIRWSLSSNQKTHVNKNIHARTIHAWYIYLHLGIHVTINTYVSKNQKKTTILNVGKYIRSFYLGFQYGIRTATLDRLKLKKKMLPVLRWGYPIPPSCIHHIRSFLLYSMYRGNSEKINTIITISFIIAFPAAVCCNSIKESMFKIRKDSSKHMWHNQTSLWIKDYESWGFGETKSSNQIKPGSQDAQKRKFPQRKNAHETLHSLRFGIWKPLQFATCSWITSHLDRSCSWIVYNMHRGDGCFSLTSSWGALPEGFGIKDRSQLGVFHWCPGRVNVLQNRIPVWKDLRHTFVVNLAKKMHASSCQCVNGASICHRLSQTAYCRCYRRTESIPM